MTEGAATAAEQIAALAHAANRECGDCKLCCKILPIPLLDKPQDTWCPECDLAKGCKVQSSKPQVCAEYYCLWLVEPRLGEHLKPNRCHVVFNAGQMESDLNFIEVYVDRSYPAAWREPEVFNLIKLRASHVAKEHGNGFVSVHSGHRNWAVTTTNEVELHEGEVVVILSVGESETAACKLPSKEAAVQFRAETQRFVDRVQRDIEQGKYTINEFVAAAAETQTAR